MSICIIAAQVAGRLRPVFSPPLCRSPKQGAAPQRGDYATATLETAVDSHTKDNRDKRKSLQERRNTLAKQMQALSMAMQEGQRGLNELHQSIEANLKLAKHAEAWEWREPTRQPPKSLKPGY
jgi:septal ring factor EnvC (AmiA/AmiB activator)